MAYINIDGTGVLYDVSDVNSGTGNYNSFLRLQKHGRERGFNTDDEKEADNKDGIWTHSLKFSDMKPIVDPDSGIEYYEIRLDLNEGNNEGGPPITLLDLRFFYSSFKADGSDFDNDFEDLEEVFDLAGTLNLEDVHSGSGSDDYVFRIPTSLFPDKTGYFTLYSDFDGADGGFEEWRVLANEIGTDGLPAIHLEKTANPTHFNEGTATDVTFTYVLTSQSSITDPLTLTSFIDDNATPDDPSDDINLLLNAAGTYLGDYYVSGDDGDGLLESTETWTFSVTITGLKYNAGTTRTNIAEVFARDDEGNQVDDADDAVVTADDVLPLITLVKDANYTLIDEGTPTDITYSYTLTSQSADTDPLTVTSLIDDLADSDPTNDVELITGVDATHKLGIYYISGDTNNDQLLQNTETWLFNYTVNDVVLNAGETRTNNATVSAKDDEDNPTGDTDDHTVTGEDLDPTLNIDKVASLAQVQAGQSTPVTFTYTLTNTSPASTDPIVITHLVDDMGTVDTGDDQLLFDGDSTLGKGIYYDSGDTNGDGLLDKGESWVYKFTTNVTLDAGETRTNIVSVDGHDDEDNEVSDTDDASITAYNLGRTPGFWSNERNGGKLWDGNDSTWPNGGSLGTTSFLGANKDLLYTIHDLNADGDGTDAGEATGRRDMIMVGDWDHDGIADSNENVLLITRTDAMSLLNASEKQQQDGRFMLARDVVASWLNYLGGSYVGDPNNATPTSVVRYVDAAVAWLQQTTDGNQIFLKSELTSGTKVGTSTAKWNTGIDLDDIGTAVNPGIPAAGQHDFVIAGANNDIDILGGGTLHTGLDHYNNFGFI